MYWNGKKKDLTPDEVKKLSAGVEVHLEWYDRHGELTFLDGYVVQSGKKKVFSYFDRAVCMPKTKAIKYYPGKRWVIRAYDS